jgi:hypothetical protein
MIGLTILYFLLYGVASWTFWLKGEHLSFKKYTLAFIFTWFVHEMVQALIKVNHE